MLTLWGRDGGRLVRRDPGDDPAGAVWIDLFRPLPAEAEAVAALGVAVPTLPEMEEIELSSRLYRDGDADVMTIVIPGLTETRQPTSGPVAFILSRDRLVTVRHHAPRPFETYGERADRLAPGCATADRIFLGLVEEIVARLADHLEAAGRALDAMSAEIFGDRARRDPRRLQVALERLGREGEVVSRVRLALLTLERAISFFGQAAAPRGGDLKPFVKATFRDIQALEEHADFLSQRLATTTDSTLGMVNLAQTATMRIISVVAALFLPPTLIASIYGMNFALMPELQQRWGYPAALGLMALSALGTYLYFRWKRWL